MRKQFEAARGDWGHDKGDAWNEDLSLEVWQSLVLSKDRVWTLLGLHVHYRGLAHGIVDRKFRSR